MYPYHRPCTFAVAVVALLVHDLARRVQRVARLDSIQEAGARGCSSVRESPSTRTHQSRYVQNGAFAHLSAPRQQDRAADGADRGATRRKLGHAQSLRALQQREQHRERR